VESEARRIATEIKVRGLNEHVALSGAALKDAFAKGDVEAVFKYDNAIRDDPGGIAKDVLTFTGEFLKEGRPTSTAVITSAVEDRDGDTVHTDGMVISESYRKHPIVMPMHMYREFPIGFTEKLTQYKNHAVAKWQWLTDEPDTDGQKFYGLWKNHVLNCVSIGFVPKRWEPKKDSWSYDFLTWELLEHSVVNIPANPDALRTDGVKEYLRAAGEMIFNGPSTLLKTMFEQSDYRKGYPVGIDLSKKEENKGVISYASAHSGGTPKAPKEDSWDGPTEVAAATVEDLKVMCAWVDSANAENKTAYKLPHHKASGHAVVWRGVAAAMGVILGARGGTNIPDGDRQGVYGHLAKHYGEFDEKAPDFKSYNADVIRPYPNEHACRLLDPSQFDEFARKNCAEKHDGKCIDVIYGIKEGASKIQALRYPKDAWTAAAAKSNCESRGGAFEPAASANEAGGGSMVDGKQAIYDAPEKILVAFEAGIISKAEASGHINALVDPLKADLAKVQRQLAVMSLRVISKKPEV
jgi:hypothetical protein